MTVTASKSLEIMNFISSRLSKCTDFNLPNIDGMHICSEQVPTGWSANGNIILSPNPNIKLNLLCHPGLPLGSDSIVIVGRGVTLPTSIVLWGTGGVVVIGDGTSVANSDLYCGDNSTIALGANISCAGGAAINARNGGLICVDSDGLWSNRVQMSTDDMHAIIDTRTGERINVYGGSIRVGRHVWLGQEVILMGGTCLGRDCIVGARSIVKIAAPQNAIVAGVPARILREGITWSHNDIPASAGQVTDLI
jgi:acetyltransferase-like isoleucine patch superfamily enzyme